MTHLEMDSSNVYNLVDSSTVLGYLQKQNAKLKPFKGVQVSEIQTAGTFKEVILFRWACFEGENNPADLVTKPRPVCDLVEIRMVELTPLLS